MQLIIYIPLLNFSHLPFSSASEYSRDPIVTAEKYMEYKRQNGHLNQFIPPQVVLICYQQSTLDYLLEHYPEMRVSEDFPTLYYLGDGRVGVLGGWGFGAPALANRMEQLAALGVKKFVAIGTAGTLLDRHSIADFIIAPKALAEDGVAHLYLNGEPAAHASAEMLSAWQTFAKEHALPEFHSASAWSFSAIFKESPADVHRVTTQGYDVVEMEAATVYAIGTEKNLQTLSLFVISDSITYDTWTPHIKEPAVRDNLHQLAEWAIAFCKELAAQPSYEHT